VDDVGLLERARRGDEEAFSRLFARYQRAVYRYAVYMAGRDAADDIVQETFLVVLQQPGRTDAPRGAVLAYLIGIARHRVLKRLSARHERPGKQEYEQAHDTVEDSAVTVWPPDAHHSSVLDDLTRTETIDAVRAAVRALPAAYREAIVLCELQEMPYAEAAEAIGCPIGTVRSRLHRAKALLMAALQTKEMRTC
jgi:RNA polymerase sigma-70 factor (ECF subfamily)